MKYLFALIISYLSLVDKSAVCQNLLVSPENPQAGQQIQFQYDPANTPLSSSLIVTAIAYVSEETGRFIKPIDILLTKNDANWTGQFDLMSGSVAFALTFKNERDIPDNNKGKGYIYYLQNKSGDVLKGAKAAAAQYFVIYSDLYKFEIDVEKAKSMFEQEFEENVDLKQYYIQPYHYTFDLSDPTERFELISELDELYKKRNQLDEITLTKLSLIYRKLLLKDKAEKCTEYTIRKHPNGTRAFQLNSLPYQREIRKTSDLKRKIKIYRQMDRYFIEKLVDAKEVSITSKGNEILLTYSNDLLSPSYIWALNENYYQAIRLISLFHLLPYCWGNETLEEWFELVEQVQNELVKMKVYNEFSLQSISKNENIAWAYELSSKAVDWAYHHIKSPRTLREKTFFMSTDSQIEEMRRIDYARFLMTKCELLLKLNKKEEALDACNKVIENSNLTDIRLNDRIVDLLLKIGHAEEAKDISKIAIDKGKATSAMKELLSEEDNENSGNIVDSLAKDHLNDKKDYLTSIRINTPAPAFDLKNIHGENVSLSNLKNKIVVLDFWATWCAPCLMSFPAYQVVIEKYKEDPEVVFLFINLDKDKKDIEKEIKQFLSKRKYDFEVLLDAKGITAQYYTVSGLPTKFVIDKNGVINFRSVGVKKDKEEMIEELSLMIEMARALKSP